MRVLHVTSDWKWTGPAAPMLTLALAQRAAGHEVALACPEAPHGEKPSLADRARERDVAPVLRFAPRRGPWDRGDVRRLRAWVATERPDVVHAWHTRDHLLCRRALGRRRSASLVRSLRQAEAVPPTPWNRWLLGPATDGLLCVSPRAAERNAGLRRGRPLASSFGAVDLARFTPAPPDPSVRARLGLAPGDRVVGIVARVQRQRRFDLLLDAASRLFDADPAARLLVVGRGTRRDELAVRPAERLGIGERVVFAGYRGDDYADVLRAMDVFTLLVPGSDGGCRALLEAAACGIPAVATERGALAELVVHGETGEVVADDPDALAGAWSGLLADDARRARLGAAARRRAEAEFAPARFAERVDALYRQLVS